MMLLLLFVVVVANCKPQSSSTIYNNTKTHEHIILLINISIDKDITTRDTYLYKYNPSRTYRPEVGIVV